MYAHVWFSSSTYVGGNSLKWAFTKDGALNYSWYKIINTKIKNCLSSMCINIFINEPHCK
jgi:hypothetical protein